jgi:cellulose synthase/poly-beta-1,6-N-acetylglucosamine synthase-like glycosyltransferase
MLITYLNDNKMGRKKKVLIEDDASLERDDSINDVFVDDQVRELETMDRIEPIAAKVELAGEQGLTDSMPEPGWREVDEDVAEVKELPEIHIIVRTHDRPKYFEQCMKSIAMQTYPNKQVHVIADSPGSFAYASKWVEIGVAYDVMKANPNHDPKSFGDFLLLKRQGMCQKDSDFRRHRYDLYLNERIAKIESGWIFIVDDDKELTGPNVLEHIAELLTSDDVVVIGQHAMKVRTVPDGVYWGKLPFTRAQVDMSCFIFNAKHKALAKFDGHGAGDWRVAMRLSGSLEVKWLKEVLTVADNSGNSGRPEK